MKVGARNQLVGQVASVKKGGIMCQVKVDVPASQMTSVMTSDSAGEMRLKKGDQVRVIVKAIQVLLLKD